MKKSINLRSKLAGAGFMAAILLLGPSSANAQDKGGNGIFTGDRAFRFGIKGGVNFSQFDSDPSSVNVDDRNWMVGIHGGVFLKAPINDLFAIQPELLYTNAGSEIEYGTSTSGLEFRDAIQFRFNYLQLPILASLTLGPISIQAGPYVSYLVNVKVNNFDPNDPFAGGTTIAEPDRDSFNTFDYGLVGGVAVDIKGFQLGARYNYGLREVGAGQVGSGNNSIDLTNGAKNSVAQVFVAVGL